MYMYIPACQCYSIIVFVYMKYIVVSDVKIFTQFRIASLPGLADGLLQLVAVDETPVGARITGVEALPRAV
jgi:hypothetical protein